ncbi:MAG: BREX system ATP-binding domain-containing protein [Eubacteriales bacterium]
MFASGVSSRNLSGVFYYGREAALERVSRELSRVKEDAAPTALVIKGNFGNGKTHFLNIVSKKAWEMNFAVSFVPLSKETPFNKLDRIYRRAVAELYLPGYSQPGFLPLLAGLKTGDDETEQILNHSERHFHPKIAAVVKNYLKGGNSYNQHLLSCDLAGDFVPVSQLKSVHRLNFGSALSLPRFTVKENVFDYFRFLSYLVRARGYAGWTILFDEFEQLMYLGAVARAEAYLNAARFISPAYGLTSTYTVFSASSNLWSELIWKQKNSDYDNIPLKLTDRGRLHDVATVREVFGCFLRDNLFLDNLSNFDIRRMLQSIRDRHALAYGWEAPLNIDDVTSGLPGDRPLRTVIRAVIEYLDLQYLYGQRPEIRIEKPEEPAPVQTDESENCFEEEVAAARDEC